MPLKKKNVILLFVQIFLILILFVILYEGKVKSIIKKQSIASPTQVQSVVLAQSTSTPFISSVDTMKESRDTENHPLKDSEIAQDVQLSANLQTTHITVDTNWDYVNYFRKWAIAIHASGKKIWVRGHPDQWENQNGNTGIMTPAMYIEYEKNFILQNADIFLPGDIFDTCSESEGGHYWKSVTPKWTAQTKVEYNQFIRDSIDAANQAFAQKGVTGVITTVHSMNAYLASHRLEKATIEKMGAVTIDTYPDQYDTTVDLAVQHRIDEIKRVYNAVHVPIILGEIGYSNKIEVSDQLQKNVLHAELSAINELPYIEGLNYWVGAGGEGHGGYTNIFSGKAGQWVYRPAAYEVKSFFQSKSTDHQ